MKGASASGGSSSSTPPVAVVGCGYWGKNLARNLAELGALGCICDTDKTSLENEGKIYHGARLTQRFDDVISDPDVRAVVIATPPALHHRQARRALLEGKDVLVEKPLALTYEQGLELVDLASQLDAVLMVGHILEYHPAVSVLKDVVGSGELGQVWYLYSNRLNLGKVRQQENILWSFAPHDISLICSLVGSEPTTVSASGGAYLQSGILDVTVTNFTFAGGVRAHIFVSWLHPYKEQKLVVVGDRKMAVFDDVVQEGKLKIYDKGIEWRTGSPVPRQTAETTLFLDTTEPMRLELEHFLMCVRERKRPLTDGENGLRVLKVLEAGQRSLEAGGVAVPVADVGAEVAG